MKCFEFKLPRINRHFFIVITDTKRFGFYNSSYKSFTVFELVMYPSEFCYPNLSHKLTLVPFWKSGSSSEPAARSL